MFDPKSEGWMAFMKSGKTKNNEPEEDEVDPELEAEFEDMLVRWSMQRWQHLSPVDLFLGLTGLEA